MKYLSVCSGIEAATVAWHSLGWKPVGFSEIEKFPSAVLNHHYPSVPNLGDMSKYKEWDLEDIDLLVGGTPCQSFSVAGLRKGLDDPRGNLALVYLGLAERFRPRWILWENVPGVLSSYSGPEPPSDLEEGQEWEAEETSDFECFLTALSKIGYGWAYRVLDAQYFGVPQRRRRVFVVGYLGDWRRAAAVLFEQHSLSGDSPPSRKTRQETAGDAGESFNICAARMTAFGEYTEDGTASCIKQRDYKDATDIVVMADDWKTYDMKGHHDPQESQTAQLTTGNCNTIRGDTPLVMAHGQGNAEIVKDGSPSLTCNHEAPICFEPGIAKREGGDSRFSVEVCPTLRSEMGDNQPAVAFAQNTRDEVREMKVVGALAAQPGAKQQSYLRQGMQVRRLLPTECESLQGFPRNYTRIPWRNKPEENCPDGPRYKALGNSMAVPCMRWLGERIQEVDTICS